MVDSGPGPGRDMVGQAGGGARARRGWVGLGVTLYFNWRHIVSFMCSPLCVRLFGFFLIDLLSDLLTHGQTLKVLEAALWLCRHN